MGRTDWIFLKEDFLLLIRLKNNFSLWQQDSSAHNLGDQLFSPMPQAMNPSAPPFYWVAVAAEVGVRGALPMDKAVIAANPA